MNEEEYIWKLTKDGHNPFKVPEDYFRQLNDAVLSRLDETSAEEASGRQSVEAGRRPDVNAAERRPRSQRLWLYAAAAVLLVVVSTTLYISRPVSESATGETLLTSNNNESYFDEAADYAMVDNQDIYAMLLADMY